MVPNLEAVVRDRRAEECQYRKCASEAPDVT